MLAADFMHYEQIILHLNFDQHIVFFCTGPHPGDLFHVWKNQNGRNANGQTPPTPVQVLRLRGV